MSSILTGRVGGNHRFHAVAEPFLQDGGLPFADVLSAETIERTFAERDAFFGQAQDEVFSTQIVLWAFLAQVLRDGKGAACAAAVADIATYMQQVGGHVPSGDTGDYCRARAKLDLAALRRLVRQTAGQLEQDAPDHWLWHGLHAKLIDGFTFTMPDTPANQQAFPQMKIQAPGVGFPIGRAVAVQRTPKGVLSLATGAIHDLALGPYAGKQTGETALLRKLLHNFGEGDLAVFDRYFASYMMVALLAGRGAHVCTRLHQARHSAADEDQAPGPYDRLVTWKRPRRPAWMSQAAYEQIPETMTLRQLQFEVTVPGRRTETITVITTLTDPVAYPAEDIAALYGFRWNAELDIRDIKQTLDLDHVRCKRWFGGNCG